MLRIFFSFLIIFTFQASNCQVKLVKETKGLDSICQKFMQIFSEKRFTEAISMLKEYSVIDPAKIDDLIYTVENQMKILGNNFGKILSYELMVEKNVKNF